MESIRTEYHPEQKIFVGVVPLAMGTKLTGMVIGLEEDKAEGVWNKLVEEVFRLDKMLNRFDPESEVYRLNLNCDSGPQPACDELKTIINLCNGYREKTSQIFDISKSGGSVNLMSDGIDLCGTTLDFGGFAKGYFLRKADFLLREAGVTQAFLCFGDSSILGIGHHPYGDCWKVSVTNPFTRRPVTEVELLDAAMSTSGNQPGYEKHIVDPRTGQKVATRKIAVVSSSDPLDAEVLSTVAMIASDEEMKTILERFEKTKLNYNQ